MEISVITSSAWRVTGDEHAVDACALRADRVLKNESAQFRGMNRAPAMHHWPPEASDSRTF